MFNTFKLFSIVGIALVAWETNGQAQNILIKDGQKIAFLGDSITAQGVEHPSGYVQLVVLGLKVNGIKVTIIGAGVGGNKSNQMLAREDADVIDQKPDWMTISCGVNDIYGQLALNLYRQNMIHIIDKAQAANIKVIILTATMITEDQSAELNQKLIPYNSFLRQLAKDKKCPLADLNADMQAAVLASGGGPKTRRGGSILTNGGVHMNALGDQVMAIGLLKTMGLNADQLQKAQESWLDLPKICEVDLNGGLTVRQLQQLDALAVKQNRPTSELLGELVAKSLAPALPVLESSASGEKRVDVH